MNAGVQERLARAAEELEQGEPGHVVGTLDDVVGATDDPEELRQMHALATAALERSGRFGRRAARKLVDAIETQLGETAAAAEQERRPLGKLADAAQ